MQWSRDAKLQYLRTLPWTVTIDREVDGTMIARVEELPSVLATGEDRTLLDHDLRDAMVTLFEAMLHHGDPIPVPSGVIVPWHQPHAHAEATTPP